MARTKGTLALSANFEPQIAAPLDARYLCSKKDDLILSTTWTAKDGTIYAYQGMITSVWNDGDNNGVYQLNGADYTIATNWIKIGDQTLLELGGQPQLNGNGFVMASGNTISYNDSKYSYLHKENYTCPFKPQMYRNLEGDFSLWISTPPAGSTIPQQTPILIIAFGTDSTYGSYIQVKNMPYISELVKTPTNWLLYDMSSDPEPDSWTTVINKVVYQGTIGSNTNVATLYYSGLDSIGEVYIPSIGNYIAITSFRSNGLTIDNKIDFPYHTGTWNSIFTTQVSGMWKRSDGVYCALVAGAGSDYDAHHLFTSDSPFGTWVDKSPNSSIFASALALRSDINGFAAIAGVNKVPGRDGYYFSIAAGRHNNALPFIGFYSIVFDEYMTEITINPLNIDPALGINFSNGEVGRTSSCYYEGEYLLEYNTGSTGFSKDNHCQVISSKSLNGLFTAHSVVIDLNIIDTMGQLSTGSMSAAVLCVINNQLYAFWAQQSKTTLAGNLNDAELMLSKYDSNYKTWSILNSPIVTALHGGDDAWGDGHDWGLDHIGTTSGFYIEDNKLYFGYAACQEKDTYQVTVAYFDLDYFLNKKRAYLNDIINKTSLYLPLTGGTVTGLLTANAGISSTTGTFSGGISATTGTFSGLLIANNGLTVNVNNGATNALTILNNRNIGIGTTNPLRKLDVITDSSQTGLYVENQGSTIYPTAIFRNNQASSYASIDVYGGSAITNSTKFQFGQYAEGDAFLFLVGNNNLDFFTNSVNRIRINSSGNVGIGTTSPSKLLSVGGSNQFTVDSNGNLLAITGTFSGLLTAANLSGTNTGDQDLSGLQQRIDTSLETNSTTIVGAINEVNSVAKGANQALSFNDYQAVIAKMSITGLNVGQNLYVGTLNVPDLWIKTVEATNVPYTYVSDTQFVNDVLAGVQIGYYILSVLETQKVDLSGYATITSVTTGLGTKVDKVTGKGLSTNDYTADEKNKLAGIELGAQVNVIENITVGGVEQAITNKTVALTIPNPDLTAYYTKTETDAKITPTTLVVFKNGVNGNFYSRTFKWPTDKTISSIQLMSNCNNISLSIGGTTYDKTTAVNVLLPANTEMTINDLTINAGFNYGEALIIF